MRSIVTRIKKEEIKEEKQDNEYMHEKREIYVMYDTEEYGAVASRFDTIHEVSEYLQVKPYVIKGVLTESCLYGKSWTSNIYTKPINEDMCYKYIIVYRDIWEGYSEKKRVNRLDKITQQRGL